MHKKFLLICLILALIFGVAIVALPLLLNPNDYKANIAAVIKEKTGREVLFKGDITVSVLPSLGLQAEKIEISNKPGIEGPPFMTVEKTDIKIKLIPLLSKKFEVHSVDLDELTLNMVTDKQGLNNWADLTASHQQPPPNAAADQSNVPIDTLPAQAALTVGAFNIQNSRVNWDNQQTGKQLALKNIHFNADKFVVGKPVKIDTSMAFSGTQVKFPGTVKWTTELQVDEKLNLFIFKDNHMEWISSNKPTSGQPLVITIASPNTAINLAQQTLQLSGLQLQSGDIKLTADITGEQVIDKPVIQGPIAIAPFNPGATLKQWGVKLPVTKDNSALTALSTKFQLKATSDFAEFSNIDVTLDNSHGKGSLTIKNFDQPAVLFDLAIDAIDIDRYLAPRNKASLTSPGMAFAASTFSIPLENLRKLDAEGKLAVGKLTFNHMTMQDLHLTLSSKKGIAKVGQTAGQFYQGTYSGNLDVDARAEKKSLALNEKLTNIQLEPFLKATHGEARMAGTLTASSQLHGLGINAKELGANLSGQFDFLIKDGYVRGFNLENMIENGKKLVKGGALPTDTQRDQTDFSHLSGTSTINKGILQNDDLIANTAHLRSSGKGTAKLDTGQLDYRITTKLVKAAATSTTPEQVHDTPIVINVSGTFSKPVFVLDIGALLTDKNKAKIERLLDKNKDKIDKLMNKLDKKLGPGASDLLKKIF